MIPGIDPKVDYAFKFLFGNEKKPQSLIRLLNAILKPSPGEEIVAVQILNPFNDKLDLDDKLSILDIKARDQSGRLFNIEMQMVLPRNLRQRILYYWARLYSSQLQKGDDYNLLRPTISVCFVDGLLFPTTPQHHTTFRLVDTHEAITLTDDIVIHFFELPKFNLEAQDLATPLDAWLYFLRHAEKLDTEAMPETLDSPEIRQAMEALMELAQIDIQKEIYEGRLKRQRDEKAFLRDTTIDREQLL